MQSDKFARSGWMLPSDPRSRIVLHMNWTGQSLPILLNGLPSQSSATEEDPTAWQNLPQPDPEQVAAISPYAQVSRGRYKTPTFIIHGTEDDLIPWQQTQRFYEKLVEQGVRAEVRILQGVPHLFDLRPRVTGEAEKAIEDGYKFLLAQL